MQNQLHDDTEAKAKRAIKIYNPFALRFYDVYVHRFVAPRIFRCHTSNIIKLYNENIRRNHLEAGVGTGYLLSKCHVLDKVSNLTIVDMNENCLTFSSKRLAEKKPRKIVANLLEPFSLEGGLVDSIAINYVMHCIPGDYSQKGRVFSQLKRHLSDNGRLFGSTVLFAGVDQSFISERLIRVYNRSGVFNNLDDDLEGLTQALRRNFKHVDINVVGSIATFSASDA